MTTTTETPTTPTNQDPATPTADTTQPPQNNDPAPAPQTDAAKDPASEPAKPEGDAVKTDSPKEDQLLFQKKDDQKPEDGDKAKDDKGDGDKDGEGDNAPKPLDYKFDDLKVPEGIEVKNDIAEKYMKIAESHKIPKEAAQAFVDLQVEMAKSQTEAWESKLSEWKEATKSHPVIGGKNLDTTITKVNDLLRNHASSPEHLERVQDYLVFMGMGNNPDILELFYNIAKRDASDSIGDTMQDGKSASRKPIEKVLWPNMN